MVRKRKNSEETDATAPRLTRLRRNLEEEGDPESTLTETLSKSSRAPKTPSAGRRNTRKKDITANEDLTMSTRSRRVRVHKSSSDSDIENKGDEPKQKSTRGELTGVESYPTRSRTRKDVNVTMQDSIITTAENEPEPKRQTRKKRVLAAADNTLTENQSPNKPLTENQSPKSIKTLRKSTRTQVKTVNMTLNLISSPQELQIEKPALNSPAGLKNKKNSTLRRIVETPRKVSPRLQSSPLLKIPSDTVTPESSPMLVNLTPHRSTKTPKKSPMNIGSPKTHSQSPLRLSKTPRKLTVNVESPATSDKSSVSATNQSPSQTNRRDPFVVLTDFKKDASPGSGKTLEVETGVQSSPSFVSTAKLRLRKLPGNKSATGSSFLTVEEAISPGKKSPVKKGAILGSKIRKSPVKTPVKTSFRKTGSVTPAKRLLSPNETPKSPRRPKSTTKKRSPITSSGTPLRPIIEREKSLSGKNEELESSPSAVAPKKLHLAMQLATQQPETTPRGRIRRSLHLTPDLIKFSSGSTSTPIPTPRRNGGVEDATLLKDVSLELMDSNKFMDDSDDVFLDSAEPADGTYELSGSKEGGKQEESTTEMVEKSEVDDATYELAEPKTPSLKKKSRKRSLSNVEPDKCTPEAKKQCRVRFASPTKKKIPGSPLSTGKKSLPSSNTPAKLRVGSRLPRANLAVESSRRRSRSLTKINATPDPKRTAIKRRSVSASNLTNKTPKLNQSTQDSVNRLSRPRQSISSAAKLEVKLPVPRKAPNFAQIHQKKFAELESLVDARKRVAKRHEELNAQPSTRASQSSSALVPEPASKKPAPTEAQNGLFNRFGFKLRKAEAVNIVTKKPAAALGSKDHQKNNRAILKGVRTNRRFELQMKARNMKP